MTTEVTDIWTQFHKELKAFIYNKTRNASDTDDILQDVFLKIIRHSDKLSEAKNLRHYLYGIVKNAVNDHFRRRKHLLDSADIEDQVSEDEAQSITETIGVCCIKPFINKLSPDYREALLLTEFQNLTQKELAEQLNISYSGAKSRVQRGKEKLKELILGCCAYESDKYGNLLGDGTGNCGCS